MKFQLTPRLACPSCHSHVRKSTRKIGAREVVLASFADVPFWIIFGVCTAIGMWQWLAGVLAFGVLAVAFVAWQRSKTQFLCATCGGVFRFSEVTVKEAYDA